LLYINDSFYAQLLKSVPLEALFFFFNTLPLTRTASGFLLTFKVLKNEIILRVIIFLTGSLSFIKSYFLSGVTPAPFPCHSRFNSAGIKSSHLERKIAILAYTKKAEWQRKQKETAKTN